MATIGLSIIAKDEAAVIERCLQSVVLLCDYFLVIDTGSTDGTQDLVRAFLARNNLAGEVVEIAWRDFAHNRTAALQALRRHGDIEYCLMIDADEQIVYDDDFDPQAFKAGLQADWLDIQTRLGGVDYLRPQLTRNALDFTYRGVLHEFLEVPPGHFTHAIASGIMNIPTPDGARSRNPRKYHDDALFLWDVLKREDDPFLRRRYHFYLGQSLRDAEEWDAAIDAYSERTTMGGWQEEIFVSYFEVGKIRARLGHPPDDVIAAYLHAHDASPQRAESLVAAARHARENERFALAYMLARRAMELTPPAAALFAELPAYTYQAKDEAAVAAYWLGHYAQCRQWSEDLLQSPALPDEHRHRITANMALASEKLENAAQR